MTLLKPYALFGLEGLNDITHAMLWSMLANVGTYVVVSVLSRQSRSPSRHRRCDSSTCSVTPETGGTSISGRAARRRRSCRRC